MKTKIFCGLLVLCSALSFSQVYSPQLAGYSGVGTIYFMNGFYQGQLYNGTAHGSGMYYYTDGTIFNGNFYNGVAHGQGVFIVPYNGYFPACFNNGVVVATSCNPYPYQVSAPQLQNYVSQAVQTYNSLPATQQNNYQAQNVSNYSVTQLNMNTAQAQSVLGRGIGGGRR